MDGAYSPPLSLVVIAGIFLVLGAVFGLVNIVDIVWRRGWRSMMWIMIPVYPINSCYMGPLTLYLYFKYGRAEKPRKGQKRLISDPKKNRASTSLGKDEATPEHSNGLDEQMVHDMEQHDHQHHDHTMMHGDHEHGNMPSMNHMGGHMHMIDPNRPTWATVLISVSHCGAGCILGDLVGEWLVYGTGVSINGQTLWPALLIDYAFALLFGIVFQYFSIAPMSGQYGPKTFVRAAKADFLSLTAFQLGLFGWMVAYQVGIWKYQLQTNSFVYWWQMQIGMFFGFWTSAPINVYLLARGIKEPCA